MIAALVILGSGLSFLQFGAPGKSARPMSAGALGRNLTGTGSTPGRSEGLAVLAADSCRSARRGVYWYGRWVRHWAGKMGAAVGRGDSNVRRRAGVPGAAASCPKYLSRVLRAKAIAYRLRYERWRVTLVARSDWQDAVAEAQKAYPGTASWLMSCSASEGGWGRWVPNSQGSGVGGWLQFHPGTFTGFAARARYELRRRGFRVPESAWSWYSPLGQALAGAWGITHGMRHHWAGRGCW